MHKPDARKPELMSPVGHWPQLRAAIEAGADAVYFGLTHFTARAKVGFTLAELPEVMRTLHSRGVRGFLTFNTLIFDHEMAEAARALEGILKAGADALIVQDPAAMLLAREIAPGVEIHASTQTSLTNADGVRWAASLGASRVNLARELSIAEIRKISEEVDTELETFVHGALCVAYSGQCFSSEAWGGRSANRGQCAQACRLPYEMVVDGRVEPLGDARYLLSPGDLCGIEHILELIDIGISAFKIEGRYKDPEYVASTTRAYRKAIDAAWTGRDAKPSTEERLELEQVYSRGLGAYFMSGTDHQAVVRGRAPRHRGVLAAQVVSVGESEVMVRQEAAIGAKPLKPGDGIVFDAASRRSPGEREEGGRLYEATPQGSSLVRLRFANQGVDFDRIQPGDLVWRTDDPDVEKSLRPITQAKQPLHRQPVHVSVSASEGKPVETRWTVGNVSVRVESAEAATVATQRALTQELVEEQLGRLGNTAYRLESLDAAIEGAPFVPTSVLNQMRRQAVEQLAALQTAPPAIETRSAANALALLSRDVGGVASVAAERQLHVLVRTNAQLDAAIAARPASITLDYLDLYGLKPSVERVRSAGIPVRVASPRVLKPGEEKIVDFLMRLDCALLVRPAGLLGRIENREITADFSFNAANAITARWFLKRGLTRLTPTHDLNAEQITVLAGEIGAAQLEVIAYQHLPVFHTEHCVFCRFLSKGTSYLDCGRPCETHSVELRDESGRAHPVLADTGCRNTVFGAEAQEATAHMDAWLDAGLRHFRLEFAHETADEARDVITGFQRALAGSISFASLRNKLSSAAPQGITQGSLYVPGGHALLKVLT